MAWESNLLRKGRWAKYTFCLDTMEAFIEQAPLWQRCCVFLYVVLGTWVATLFGVDMETMWAQGEIILRDMAAVGRLKPREIAEKLNQFVSVKLRGSSPLEFDQAKSDVYDREFWPMAAHMALALQPSAIARKDFVLEAADWMDKDHARVADLGCGPGVILCSLLARKPTWEGVGLDVSHPALQYAARLAAHRRVGARAKFAAGDLTDLPYPNQSFDLVVASEVLEHVPDIQKALRELARVLRPGGKVVMTVPLHSRTALHQHSLSVEEDLSRLYAQAGLSVRRLEIRYYLGFGDDWCHAFVVAAAGANGHNLVKRNASLVYTYARA